jgi:predicted nucleic acid-binding protein
VIFLDTSVIYAAADEADLHHEAAVEALDRLLGAGEELLVHNYVLAEVSALIQSRLGLSESLSVLEGSGDFQVHWITAEDHAAAVALLARRGRRDLSLVDCASFVVMRRYGLTHALAYDADFAAEGFTTV